MKRKFRFEDLEIWNASLEIGDRLFDLADGLEERKMYRFAEQLRGAGLSISNNIAEGAGSFSNREFYVFLNYARRSCFECANMVIVLTRRKLVEVSEKDKLFDELEVLSRKINRFQRTLQPPC